MNKKQQWILALLCTAGVAYAQDFRCKVDQIISAAPLNAQGQTFLNQTYLGKEFTVERRTGQMAGVLKILSPVATQVIDMGDKDNGFKTVATMRKEQGLGAASAVYALVINTFDELRASLSCSPTTPRLTWVHAQTFKSSMKTRMKKLRTCPCCGAAELVADCCTITAIVNSKQITVPNVHGEFFPASGEGIPARAEGNRYVAALALARKNLNG